MRTAIAPLLLAGLFAFAGLGVLHAIRPLRPTVLSVVAALGLAWMLGVAFVIVIAIALLVAGVAFGLTGLTVLCLVVGTTGIALGQRRSASSASAADDVPLARLDRVVLIGVIVVFALFSAVALTQYTSAPMAGWDAWSLWIRKAVALYHFGTLEPGFWTARVYDFTHQDYPLLLPMLEMFHFRAVTRPDTQSVHIQLWFMLVAFPWALGYLAARSGRAAVWAPIALGAAAAPGIITVIIDGLADVPVMLFGACGILALGLWIERRETADLTLAVILLAGAASTKNEGVLLAIAALAVAALVVAGERPRRPLRDVAIAGGAFVLAILPWQLWAAVQGVPKDLSLGDLAPGHLLGQADRVWPSVQAMYVQITDQERWSYLLPLAIIVAAVALWTRRASRAASFYLITGAAIFAGLVLVYWASPYPIDWYLGTSAFRVVGGVLAVSMAALIHLAPRLAGDRPLGGAGALAGDPGAEVSARPRASAEPAPPLVATGSRAQARDDAG